MDAPKKNKLAMFEATNTVLTEKAYQAIWQGTPGFVQLHTDFTGVLDEINGLAPQQGRRTTGVAGDKDAARLAMCKAANIIAGAVAAYAHKINNHELLTRVDTTLSILTGGRGQNSSDKCKDILSAATANLTVLGDYDVKQADLDNLSQLIDAYNQLAPAPQVARATGKSASQALDAAFDKADGILNNGLDNLMLKYEDTNPDFFRDYMNARQIVDIPGGRGTGPKPAPAPTANVKK